ncbi:Prophage antirepressor [Methylomagnum ishizawai]|uniref:Prophage antirepressor n=1 Tax=Methylomagnum ishizawai TaxID=1760988 RepID=A0A1Y6D0J4_9GAMM|nr:BRO family protein [Methylomagnum ishizawai]SMF96157.1 Prophage antirepressor [Methylomagnum ishizawai]
MQQQELLPFEFQGFTLRVERDDDGEPVFHAGDLCAMLGYANPRDAVAQHVEPCDVVKRDVTYPDATGKQRKTQLENWVREPGLWCLILGSHAANALPIRRWVTAEVLPAIRKTGGYQTQTKSKTKPLAIPHLLTLHGESRKLMQELKREMNPAIRRTLHAQLEQCCLLTNIPVPALADIGRELVPEPVPPLVAEFWETYDFLGPELLNHSANPALIAISLPHFAQVAAEHRIKVAPMVEYRRSLGLSASPKFIEIKSVHSVLHARHNESAPLNERLPKTVKCWLFEPVQPPPPS